MNSEILYITKRLGFPSSFGMRSGLGDFLEQYPDGIYAETGSGAPIGWESAAVWFGGASERAAARFERMVAERNDVSRLFRTRVSGVLLLTFLYRLKKCAVTAVPVAGGTPPTPPTPTIDPRWLYFTMPEGGTVTLTKNGNPTAVTLEYSLDNGSTWTEWTESAGVRTLTLNAGQTMHVRNTSATSTGFSLDISNYYGFSFSGTCESGGEILSLLCKNSANGVITQSCFFRLFRYCNTLTTPPKFSATTLDVSCYYQTFAGCTSLTIAPELMATQPISQCYYRIFYGCSHLERITLHLTDVSPSQCISDWLSGVSATGDFYCPAELTIPTGSSGIPSGWTRHDI